MGRCPLFSASGGCGQWVCAGCRLHEAGKEPRKGGGSGKGKSPQSAWGVRRAGSVGWGVSCKRPAEASQEANGRVPRETGRQAGEREVVWVIG